MKTPLPFKMFWAITALSLAQPFFLLATAADESKADDQAIAALLEAMGTRAQMENTLQQMEPFMESVVAQSAHSRDQTERQKEITDAVRAATWAWMEEELNWETLSEIFIPAYRKTFTAREIEDLTAFFNSSVGQVFVNKQAALSEYVLVEYQKRMLPMMERMEERVRKISAEVEKAYADEPDCCGQH